MKTLNQNKTWLLLLLGATVWLTSCTNKEVKLNELTKKNGLFTLKTDTIPFTGKVKETYPSGQISLIAKIDSGRYNGYYLTYYQNGKSKDSVLYEGGLIKMHKRFLENGQNNKISVKSLIHKKDGRTYYIENKRDTLLFSGIATDTTSLVLDSATLEVDSYDCVEKNYLNGVLNGCTTEYLQSKKSRTIAEITNYKDNKKNGKSIIYYCDNGKIYELGQFINDKKTGKWISYHKNGKVNNEGNYTNDEKKGIWKSYYETGKIKGTETFKNGRNDYDFVDYYENGHIKQRGAFKYGKKDGDWTWYYSSGGIESQSRYAHGETMRKCDCCGRWYILKEGWCARPPGISYAPLWSYLSSSVRGGPYCSQGCAARCE